MAQNKTNNKIIAKNTVFLYFRMLMSMAVSLYTIRVVLNALGAEDYGLYNVIGGILSILSVLKVLVSSGTQRFLTYEMGQDSPVDKLLSIFTSSLTLFFIVGGVIFVIAETVGLWFLNTQMIIPEQRMFAANVVYQFTIASMFVTTIQIPYTSAILSHERMDVYGYIGISEPFLRLGLISLLPFLGGDKLIIYAFMLFLLTLLVTLFYIYYCRRNFEECRLRISRDWNTAKTLVSFTVWNLLETISNSLSGQGQNIILNIFFGPVVNASRAVAYQVNHAVQGFASNFLIATFPQITKNYAAGRYEEFYTLMIRSSKFAFIVLSILFIPICLNTEYILTLWLKDPPHDSALFVNLVIIGMLIRMVSEPLYTGIQATGNIKKYQIYTNVVTLLNLPVCYVLLKVWNNPSLVFIVTIALSFYYVGSRTYFLNKQADFPVIRYLTMLVNRCALPFVVAFAPLYILNDKIKIDLMSFFIISLISILWSCVVFCFVAMDRNERQFIKNLVFKRKNKI